MSAINPENSSESLDLVSLGSWLKASREGRGETISDVSKVTRIGKNYLEAIEEGASSKLPSQAYTRGFIRLYASHLGFSQEEILSKMDMGQSEPATTAPSSVAARIPVKPPSASYSRAVILILLLSLASVSGYFLARSKPATTPEQSRPAATAHPPDNERKAAALQPGVAPEGPPSPPKQSLPSNVDPQGIVLRLKAVSDGRIHITIDGSISQDYDLVAGDLVEWKAERAFLLDLDNAASVEGELDGVKLGPFGEPGKAAHLVLKADGAHKE